MWTMLHHHLPTPRRILVKVVYCYHFDVDRIKNLIEKCLELYLKNLIYEIG